MKSGNGADYAHNYDVIVKWLAAALKGQTLEVIGVKTGRIEEVFGFEPADISVKSGRVDVMLRDETGDIYHIEEQRNLEKSDMYRFAVYHFTGAKQWGPEITDVILASGNVYAGEKKITTRSGAYTPVVVDFSQKDGASRLKEIRKAVDEGDFDNWLELVFLPLYGKEDRTVRGGVAEQVIRFETELFQAKKIPSVLLAATLVMANKLIDKERIRELWEEIKMLDVLDVAREKGLEEGKALGVQEGKALGVQEGKVLGVQEGKVLGVQEGKVLGVQEGKLENAREMLLDALFEKFGAIPPRMSTLIRTLQNLDTLKFLFRQVFRCHDLQAFEKILSSME